MKNYTKIMEGFWLVVAIATTLLAFKTFYKGGVTTETIIFLFPPIVALACGMLEEGIEKKFKRSNFLYLII